MVWLKNYPKLQIAATAAIVVAAAGAVAFHFSGAN
jgi:hypothetical protein